LEGVLDEPQRTRRDAEKDEYKVEGSATEGTELTERDSRDLSPFSNSVTSVVSVANLFFVDSYSSAILCVPRGSIS
jgi:hypothetical protein